MGSYPRPYGLNEYIKKFRSGKIGSEELDKAVGIYTQRLFGRLREMGFSYITDGMFRYDDIVDTVYYMVRGVEKGELIRFYDNNFYYRKPVIKARIQPDVEAYVENLKKSKQFLPKDSSLKLKAYALGPLSLYELCDNRYYEDPVEMIFDYMKVLRDLSARLSGIVDALELHEPSFFMRTIPRTIRSRVGEIYSQLSDLKLRKSLLSYFSSDTTMLPEFFKAEVDFHGIDVVSFKQKLAQVHGYVRSKNLILGLIDSRNTKLERTSLIKRVVFRMKEKGASSIVLSNNAPMDFIPEVVALRKLSILAKFRGG